MDNKVSLKSKYFGELTTKELYEILKARAEIFVVEQNCVYQDLDGIDYECLHVFYEEEDGKVTAYLRAFFKDDDTVQMGRVLTLRHGTGLGGRLLKEGIARKEVEASDLPLMQFIFCLKSSLRDIDSNFGLFHTVDPAVTIAFLQQDEEPIKIIFIPLYFKYNMGITISIVCSPAGHTG